MSLIGKITFLWAYFWKVKYVNFTAEQRQKLLYIAKEVFIEIPNKKNIVPDSPCLNNSQIFGVISVFVFLVIL